MTTNIWNESKAVRGQSGAGNTGSFATHQHTSAELTLTLDTPTGFDPAAVRSAALDPNTGSVELAELADADDWLVDRWIVRHPSLDAGTLTTIFERGDTATRMAAVTHPNASPELLRTASVDRARDVRILVGEHPNLTPEDQLTLACDPLPEVRNAVLNNTNLTSQALSALRLSGGAWIHERLNDYDLKAAV
jgi:hypothetical protein